MDAELVGLYASDFFARNRRTFNALCLYYDRVFFFDYFGVLPDLPWANPDHARHRDLELLNEELWAWAPRLSVDAISQLRDPEDDPLDAAIRRSVATGFGSSAVHEFSPSFVKQFAAQFSSFIRGAIPLIREGVLDFWHHSRNPFSPLNTFRPDDFSTEKIKFHPDCDDTDVRTSLDKCRDQLQYACLWEHVSHSVPLIADSSVYSLRWDRSADLIAQTLATTAIMARVPTIANVPAESILEARHRLRDRLPAFRRAVLEGAWEVSVAVSGGSLEDVRDVCKLFYDTKMAPVVRDLEAGIRDADRSAMKGLLEKSLDTTIVVAKYVDPTEAASKWDLIGSALKSLLKLDSYIEARRTKPRSAYEFLIELPRVLERASRG